MDKAVKLARELGKKKVDEGLAFTPCVFCGKPVAYVKCLERALCQEHSDCEKRIRELVFEAFNKKKREV